MRPEGGIASIASMTSGQTEEALMKFVNTMPKVEAYNRQTVDDILEEMSSGEVEDLLRKAINKSLPLLSYTYRGFNADLKNPPVESYYIGVADKNRSRLIKDNLFQNLVMGAKDIQFSEVGLDNRIIIYRQLGVIPAFAIKALDNYETEYEKWEDDKPRGSHWDSNLHRRMVSERYSLLPKDTVNERNLLELWVNAIIYDLISYDPATRQYRIKSRGLGGKALRGWLVDMGASRNDAFRFVEDNIDVLKPEIQKALDELDVPGPDNIIRNNAARARKAVANGTYLEEISKCPVSMENIAHYPAEEKLLNMEMDFILDNL